VADPVRERRRQCRRWLHRWAGSKRSSNAKELNWVTHCAIGRHRHREARGPNGRNSVRVRTRSCHSNVDRDSACCARFKPPCSALRTAPLGPASTANRRSVRNASLPCRGRRVVSAARSLPTGTGTRAPSSCSPSATTVYVPDRRPATRCGHRASTAATGRRGTRPGAGASHCPMSAAGPVPAARRPPPRPPACGWATRLARRRMQGRGLHPPRGWPPVAALNHARAPGAGRARLPVPSFVKAREDISTKTYLLLPRTKSDAASIPRSFFMRWNSSRTFPTAFRLPPTSAGVPATL